VTPPTGTQIDVRVIKLENQKRDQRISDLEEQNRQMRAQLAELVRLVRRSGDMGVIEQMNRFKDLEKRLGIR